MPDSTAYERILCYLTPIESLLRDEEISEVIVNADRSVFIERAGLLQRANVVWDNREYLGHALRSIARSLGQDITPDSSTLDTRLPDGSRVAIAVPPVSPEGPTVTIRKFQRRYFTLDKLVEIGTVSPEHAERLRHLIRVERANILISGGTGAGKTSLLNALVAEISQEERIGIIEDTREIQAISPNRFQFEARPDGPTVTIRDLVKASALRHRPDRLIVGEVRGHTDALRERLLDRMELSEVWHDVRLISCAYLADLLRKDLLFTEVAARFRGRLDFDWSALIVELVEPDAAPLLTSLRFTSSGLQKRRIWERVWDRWSGS